MGWVGGLRVLVTGAAGSIGRTFCAYAAASGFHVFATDIDRLDVTDEDQTHDLVSEIEPDVVLHLAGAKHAPEGELNPGLVTWVNAGGTMNVVDAAAQVGARVVTASTCKACDPETAYGASKLLAERITLNAGGSVVRFYNIPESDGNVFRLWESIPAPEPLPVTNCYRYFISMEQAVALTAFVLSAPPGRYTTNPGESQWMPNVCELWHPGREQVFMPRRRGDRRAEPLVAQSERIVDLNERRPYWRITSPHDPVLVAA